MTFAAVIPLSDFGKILQFCCQVLGASLFFITAHAAFYNYDALEVAEDQEQLVGAIVEEV